MLKVYEDASCNIKTTANKASSDNSKRKSKKYDKKNKKLKTQERHDSYWIYRKIY